MTRTRTSTRTTSEDARAALRRWRRDTPGCRDRVHLNNAGASLMPRPVSDVVHAQLEREAAIGGYEAADAASEQVAATYVAVAELIGAAPRYMSLVENSTAALARALDAGQYVYFHNKPQHPGWVASMQYNAIRIYVTRGSCRYAIPNEESTT